MALAVIEWVLGRWSDRWKIDERRRDGPSVRSLNCHSARLITLEWIALYHGYMQSRFKPVTFLLLFWRT